MSPCGCEVSGSASRDRGKRGEAEAKAVLAEHGYDIIDQPCGKAVEDIIAIKDGVLTSVEVKNCEGITPTKFRKQAKEQAKRRKAHWLLLVRWPGHPYTFAVEGSNIRPTFWHGNGGR